MAREKPIEVITPPNTLKVKVGGRLPQLDQAAIARAEAALKQMSVQFGDWIADEVARLDEAAAAARQAGLTAREGELLYRRAHDLKGLGTTYEYPIVTRLAGSLCKMIETDTDRAKASTGLVDAHVGAIKAAVRDGIRDDAHPIGRMLAEELESRVLAAKAA